MQWSRVANMAAWKLVLVVKSIVFHSFFGTKLYYCPYYFQHKIILNCRTTDTLNTCWQLWMVIDKNSASAVHRSQRKNSASIREKNSTVVIQKNEYTSQINKIAFSWQLHNKTYYTGRKKPVLPNMWCVYCGR